MLAIPATEGGRGEEPPASTTRRDATRTRPPDLAARGRPKKMVFATGTSVSGSALVHPCGARSRARPGPHPPCVGVAVLLPVRGRGRGNTPVHPPCGGGLSPSFPSPPCGGGGRAPPGSPRLWSGFQASVEHPPVCRRTIASLSGRCGCARSTCTRLRQSHPHHPGTCAQRTGLQSCRAPTAAGAGPTRSAPSVSKRLSFWKPSPLSRRPPMAGVPTGVTRLWLSIPVG